MTPSGHLTAGAVGVGPQCSQSSDLGGQPVGNSTEPPRDDAFIAPHPSRIRERGTDAVLADIRGIMTWYAMQDHRYVPAVAPKMRRDKSRRPNLRDAPGGWSANICRSPSGSDRKFLNIVARGINQSEFRKFCTSIALGNDSVVSIV